MESDVSRKKFVPQIGSCRVSTHRINPDSVHDTKFGSSHGLKVETGVLPKFVFSGPGDGFNS